MPLELGPEAIGQWLGSFLWPLFRIASFLMVIPVIGTQLVPMRIRLILAVGITVLVVPLLDDVPAIDGLSVEAAVIAIQQILIGAAMGFSAFMLFQLFVVAGQMIAMQMGLGFASMVDPTHGVNVPVLSQFYLNGVTLLFLATNGHLVLFDVLIESFHTLPIGMEGLAASSYHDLAHRMTWLFASAMVLALPATTAVLLVYISFGVMTRAAPQMNIFAIGFPIALLFGLFANWVLFGDLAPRFQRLSEETFLFMRELQR